MRWVLLTLLVGCGFSVEGTSVTPPDVSIDAPPLPDTPPPITWAIDGTSGIAVPANAQEWSDLLSARNVSARAPAHVWLMQETSGSLQNSVGTTPLNALNSPTYRHTVTGWSRLAVGTSETVSVQGFHSDQLGNLNGTSYLMLVYAAVPVRPPSERVLFAIGRNLDYRYVAITGDAHYRARGNGVTAGNGTADVGTRVHPVLMKIDPTRQQFVVYSDQEKIAAQWTATNGVGNNLVVGSGGYGSANSRYLYAALWSGADAELDDATIRNLMIALGWDVAAF